MNILVIDEENCGLAFCMRALDYDHEVHLWQPKLKSGDMSPIGRGIVMRIDNWEADLKWADLILCTGNSMYRQDVGPLFEKGYPILGCCDAGSEMENDRAKGQEVFEQYGIDTASYQVFHDYDKAIAFVKKENLPFAVKPWGGAADKALSFVAKRPDDLIVKLQKWKEEGKIKGDFILQELIEGIEIGVSGWFGPGGWSRWIEEDWEEKKLMAGGYGPNTGEQGTVVRFVRKSKLFREMLEPITEHLDKIQYVGNINVNCIVDAKGKAWPLEFTCRLGWPAFNIQLALTQDDPAQWMLHLLQGRDTMSVSGDIAIGVVMTHGDYPTGKMTLEQVSGFPIRGITNSNSDSLFFQQVNMAKAPTTVGDSIRDQEVPCTAGDYVLVATGVGSTVKMAQKAVYKVTNKIDFGGASKMLRTDIGVRLKKELPLLQSFGYALGMEY